jgi:hypothetical protein
MTSTILVKRLNKSGYYNSSLDCDNAFKGKDNPQGYFKMRVEPIEGAIKYMKVEGGYLVSGEGYIFSGSESDIADRIKAYNQRNAKYRDKDVKHVEVFDESELW